MKAVQILAARSATAATRTLRASTCRFSITATRSTSRTIVHIPLRTNYRSFSSSKWTALGLQPDTSEPKAPNTQDHDAGQAATEISDSEYHEIADQYIDSLVLALEDLVDGQKGGEAPVEVEYAAGVLTIGHPSKGTYVLNKQPPNKQIWLSSPESGPKRFDWTVPKSTSGGMNSKQDQEDSHGDVGDNGILGGGKWVYLRDGTALSEILKNELGVVVAQEDGPDAIVGQEGPGGSGAIGAVEG